MDGFAYPASKAAVTQMMRQFAKAFVEWDVRVNVIAPGGETSLLPLSTRHPSRIRKAKPQN